MKVDFHNKDRVNFFRFGVNLGARVTRFKLVNESEFSCGFYSLDQRIRGFGRHRAAGVRLKYLVEGTSSQVPMMAQPDDIWFIASSAVKEVLESVDPNAFDFIQIDAKTDSGTEVSDYWLCDVVRTLDAVDEERSIIHMTAGNPKFYYLVGQERLSFKNDVVKNKHIFRLTYAPRYIVCDDIMRNACKHAGLKAFRFDVIDATE